MAQYMCGVYADTVADGRRGCVQAEVTTPQFERLAVGGVVTRTAYYSFGNQRVAMRVYSTWPGDVYWLHGDHLGSANLTTDAAGNPKAEQRYYPFGETRWVSPTLGTLPTDRRFTGQLELAGLGIYDYGARAYSPLLGRFLSADTIVPQPGNPQTLNRYAYALGNPLKYTDPTGHFTDEEIQYSLAHEYCSNSTSYTDCDAAQYVFGQWQKDEYWMWVLHEARVGYRLWSATTPEGLPPGGRLGATFRFLEGDRIRLDIRIETPGGQRTDPYDLWQFHGGPYMLQGPSGERPFDPYARGYSNACWDCDGPYEDPQRPAYYEWPVYTYNSDGLPSLSPTGRRRALISPVAPGQEAGEGNRYAVGPAWGWDVANPLANTTVALLTAPAVPLAVGLGILQDLGIAYKSPWFTIQEKPYP